jgi:glycosyltransferase involved in cell wall biosynthesis
MNHKKRLNLGIIVPFLEKYGGAERYLIECVHYWQNNHNITLYATGFNKKLLLEHGIDPSIPCITLSPYFPDDIPHSFLLNATLLPKIWRDEIGTHDIYHTHLWPTHLIDRHPMVWFPHEPLRMLHDLRFEQNIETEAGEMGRKIHIYPKHNYDHIGNHLFDAYLNTINKMDKTSIPLKIVANSQYIAKYLEQVYDSPVSDVVYPGVNPEVFPTLPIDNNLFITISQLWPHKRVKLLIEAIALTYDTQLAIIGSGPDKQYLLNLIKKLGLEDRVFIISGLSNHELNLLLSRACAFLFGAIREPFGIVILEAMAAGKPIVAVDQGGYTEICEDSFSFLIPPIPSVFAEKISFLQSNPDVAKKMGDIARQKSFNHTWKNTAHELEKIILATYQDHRKTIEKNKPVPQQKGQSLFGIQYYLWYGEGFGSAHWNDNPKSGYVNDKPILGYYGSLKGETIHFHLDLFEKMNLDFVILNLHVDHGGVNGFELMSIQHLFDIAKLRKTKLKFVIQLSLYVLDSVNTVITTLEMITKLFSHSEHYLTLDERPVIFWFWTGVLDGNKSIIEDLKNHAANYCNIAISLRIAHAVDEQKLTFNFFEGFIPFSPLELCGENKWEEIWQLAYSHAENANMHYRGISISPGYDDRHLEDEDRTDNPYRVVSRENGKTYERGFAFAESLRKKPDLTIISTFNEFHENSHIEPTLSHGNSYIDITQKSISILKNKWNPS